ncbi:MAG TPA: glutamate synthase [Lentisphaeria bacterium]|nr:MAG: glutamate synthase [Lentisphaerae bacterium GWF2_38_69]HBM15712.1 glutamate synthase [Lentisphaeria bacterium]
MGKPRGFLDIEYKGAKYRGVEERLRDFSEVEVLLTEEEIHEQAARCMDCGIPFCHGSGCPLGNLIPEFNEYVYRGHWKLALGILLSTNDFPEFTGRVCPALCEASCTAGLNGDPVSIRQIEISLIEKGFREGFIKPYQPKKRTNKSVAVIGSGPAGLSVANRLNKFGHSVTVFEKEQYVGGLLRYGIPDFKLSKKIVQRRVDLMTQEGIKFETSVSIGQDITPSFLLKKFDAVCIAVGSRNPRDIKVPGRELKNIHFAMDYLTQQNKIVGDEKIDKPIIFAEGRKVLVIGGGDTGSDCVGTANRQGASSVTQIEILPMPPEKRSDKTPWPQWPYQLRTSSSHKEGCNRAWGIGTKSFSGTADGRVSRINAVKVNWDISAGGFPVNMKEIQGSEFSIDADLVFLSMGFTGPADTDLFNQFNLKFDQRTNIKTDDNCCAGHDKVFATGDAVTGASLVVRAMQKGRDVAAKINDYLSKN